MLEFGIVNVANADVISALLDGRVGLETFDLLVGVIAKPLSRPDMSDDVHFGGVPGAHINGSRPGFHLQIHTPAHFEGAVKFAVCGGEGRQTDDYEKSRNE